MQKYIMKITEKGYKDKWDKAKRIWKRYRNGRKLKSRKN